MYINSKNSVTNQIINKRYDRNTVQTDKKQTK
jgi:hypothetical protein